MSDFGWAHYNWLYDIGLLDTAYIIYSPFYGGEVPWRENVSE